MTALEYFRLLAPEFAAVSDNVASVWITMAGNLASTAGLDAERAAMALALYGAHLLRLTQTQATGSNAALGAITSEREGDLQRTYAQVKGSSSWLGQTTYGLQFIEVTKVIAGAGIMTRVVI